jgi:addiction module HigA family antidote
MTKLANPVHPGEILREEFLAPHNLTAGKVAKAIDVPRTRIERVVEERTPITADTAVRLARFFGNSSQFWLNLQSHYDLEIAKRSLAKAISKIEPYKEEAA